MDYQSRIPRPGQQMEVIPMQFKENVEQLQSQPTLVSSPVKPIMPENRPVTNRQKSVSPKKPAYDGFSSDDDTPYKSNKPAGARGGAAPRDRRRANRPQYQRQEATLTTSMFTKLGITEAGFDSDSSAFSPSPMPKTRHASRLPPSLLSPGAAGSGGERTATTGSLMMQQPPCSPFEQLQARLSKSNFTINALEQQVAESAKRNVEMMNQLEMANDKVAVLETKLAEKQKQLVTEQQNKQSSKTKHDIHNDSANNAAMDALRSKSELLERQLTALRASNERAQNERAELASSQAALLQKLEAAQAELRIYQQRQLHDDSEVSATHAVELAALQKAMDVKTAMLTETQQQLKMKDDEVAELQHQLLSMGEQQSEWSEMLSVRTQGAENRIMNLNQQLAALESKLLEAEQEKAVVEQSRLEAETSKLEAVAALGESTSRVEHLLALNEKLNSELQATESKCSTTTNELNAARAAVNAATAKAQQYEQRLQDLESSYAEVNAVLQSTVPAQKAAEDAVRAKEQEISRLVAAVEEIKMQANGSAQVQAVQAHELSEAKMALQHAMEGKDALLAQVSELQSVVTSQQAQHIALDNELQTVRRQLSMSEAEVETHKQAAAAWETERARLEATNAQLQQRIADLQNETQLSTAAVAELQHQLAASQAQAQSAEAAATALKTQFEATIANATNSNDAVAAQLQMDLAETQSKAQAMSNEIAALQAQLQHSTDELSSYQGAVTDLRSQLEVAQQYEVQCSDLHATVAAIQAHVASYQTQVTDLQQRIHELESTNQSYEGNVQAEKNRADAAAARITELEAAHAEALAAVNAAYAAQITITENDLQTPPRTIGGSLLGAGINSEIMEDVLLKTGPTHDASRHQYNNGGQLFDRSRKLTEDMAADIDLEAGGTGCDGIDGAMKESPGTGSKVGFRQYGLVNKARRFVKSHYTMVVVVCAVYVLCVHVLLMRNIMFGK